MYSNKRQKTCFNNVSQKRQSFCERICDDLSESILQYLSLKDKLRLESVSKQFRRTILKREYSLRIISKSDFKEENIETKLLKTNGFDLISFECLLKKCPNIRSIEMYCYSYRCKDYNPVIDLITKYCHNLSEFKCPLSHINSDSFNEFKNKFELSLKSFNPIQSYDDFIRSKMFPNIESMSLLWVGTTQNNIISRFEFNKIKKLEVSVSEGFEVLSNKLIKKLQTLQYLRLTLYSLDEVVVQKVLRDVSQLKQLIHLEIHTEFGFYRQLFVNCLTKIAINCQKLKSIETDIEFNENVTQISQILTQFKSFKELNKLKLCFYFDVSQDFSESFKSKQINKYFSFNSFKGLSNITHLSLDFSECPPINPKILTGIDTYLPKLQYLKISTQLLVEKTTEVSDIVYQMIRLKQLKTISLRISNERFGHQFVKQLTEKHTKLQIIDIK